MTISPDTRTPLQRLEKHSQWLTLAALNGAYLPVTSLLIQPVRDPADNYLTNFFILVAAAALWVISLLILICVALRHRDLHDLARQSIATPATAPVATKAQRRLFGNYRDAACASFIAGPMFLSLLGSHNLGTAALCAVFVFVINLPVSLTWLIAARNDANLVRRPA